MECTLSGNAVKGLHRAVACLARVGPELLLEALPDKVTLRSLNSARSAFVAITFRRHFFDRLQLSSSSAQCGVLLKAVCTVLRTQPGSVERMAITLPDSNASKLKWTIDCLNGLRKTYWISCNNDIEMQHVAIERNIFPSNLVARPRDFSRLLANFQSSLQEITLIATEPFLAPTESEGKAVELRSYIDPVKENNDGALHTQLWIDPAEELRDYHHTGVAVDVTFSVKELKAFMNFCEGSEADMQLFFDKAGSPILLAPKFSVDDAANADFDATLVLATMLGSQLRSSDSASDRAPTDAQLAQGAPQAGYTTPKNAANKETAAMGSGPRSDHTVIWSELSGTADQRGRGYADRLANQQPRQIFPDSGDATEELPFHRHDVTLEKDVRNGTEDDVVQQPPNDERSAQQLFGKDLSNWIAADTDEENDGDGFCVQATPPHRRG
ncbi:cell cycle checkpoint control protein RAD9B [Selaginella moellendorffii]|uniref:cell cycle checkpoint control protein RAD9B n=1 Tax=Selaginella moellendorffii TaxID=88036 RepID=UPI000D1C3071|nr:cell cycle checkpoint control protein RAD9B [Selaginella moellendorffii]XP_024545154.1 cell cycle checkpoint control protein RAD9B [Selaginella moellendorffii]XP_024545155.1 cell cycle checkpoint control protein RAD9B [Selaginella moellendorffii]|eukprot:XP_024545153.1 cell cycle checkpoint control protein RAD9B [Selaginella moellendorffii]